MYDTEIPAFLELDDETETPTALLEPGHPPTHDDPAHLNNHPTSSTESAMVASTSTGSNLTTESTATTASLPELDNRQQLGGRCPFGLCLTSHLGEGSTGDVWKGTLAVPDPSGSIVLNIVAKFSWKLDGRTRLLEEKKILKHLQTQRVEGVPLVIGLYDDRDDGAPVLVTTYAGQRIETLNQENK